MRERRRTERVFLRVPILVHGVDQNGRPFSEQTSTIEVNRDGARIGLKTTPRLGAEVRISNLATNFTALFRVMVQCPQSYGGSQEWGVALCAPLQAFMSDFWGIAFESLETAAEPHIAALLACRVCGRQEVAGLSEAEYKYLLEAFDLPRICAHCQQSTEWEPALLGPCKTAPSTAFEDKLQETASSGNADPQYEQRRGTRRVAVRVPILVKTADGRTEETVSRDVSKTGLSFATMLDLPAGESVDVVVGHGVSASPITQTAFVVWRRPEGKGLRALVGVRFSTTEGMPLASLAQASAN